MARSSECTGLYAQKVLDGNDIVRDGDFSPIAGPLPLNSGQIAFDANVLPDGRGTTD